MEEKLFRGMKTGGVQSRFRSRYITPNPENVKNWSITRRINGENWELHTVSVKEPTKEEIKSLRKQYRVRTYKENHPRFGYRTVVLIAPIIGKNAEYVAPKKPRTKKSKKTNKGSK